VIHFLKALGCLFGVHAPMRDRSGSVLIYRCSSCLQDLGPILKKEEIMRAPTTDRFREPDQRVVVGAGSERG
jgi:hypothetical protein